MQRTNGVSGTSKMYYLHTDHLGSVVSVTDAVGTLTPKPIATDPTVSQRYYAYGKTRIGGNLPTDYTFTGQKQDSTGLMYFNARYFDPQIGAFISPDTLIPDPTDIYSYNRYMAFRGNPMKYNDPSGHFWNWVIGGASGFAVGATMYTFNEIYQDGVDLSIDVAWDGWVPTSIKTNDWGDMLAAGGNGAVAGLLVATPGMGAAGASMAGNLLSDHFSNAMNNEDFSAYQHTWNGAIGAISGAFANGIAPGKGGNAVIRGIIGGGFDVYGDYENVFGNESPDYQKLATNIAFNIGGEMFGSGMGELGEFAATAPWSKMQENVWEAAVTQGWKYLEGPAKYVLDNMTQD